MMLLGMLCLVATAVALPVIPEAPVLPDSGIITFGEDLHTNVPKIVEISAEEQDVKEDKNKETVLNKVVLLPELPPAPELPPLGASILKKLQRTEETSQEFDEGINSEADESVDDEENVKKEDPKEEKSKEEEFKEEELNKEEPEEEELKEEEVKKEEAKEEEPKKDDVKVTIEDIQEKPVSDSKKPVIIKWKIPRPSFLNNIFPFHLPSISSIWPFRGTSIRAHPRISYPEYVVDQI